MNTTHNSKELGLGFGKRHTYSSGPFPLAPSLGILVPSLLVVAVIPQDSRGVETDTNVSEDVLSSFQTKSNYSRIKLYVLIIFYDTTILRSKLIHYISVLLLKS